MNAELRARIQVLIFQAQMAGVEIDEAEALQWIEAVEADDPIPTAELAK